MALNDPKTDWWREAVIYQVYVRSFADGDGDGVGDLPGITSRLPHLRDLGVDALWITPFYPSPQHDHGYDVADYRDVDPRFGTLADADELLRTAHELGLRVIVDIVPNHTSSDHAWFQAALAAGPGSPERDRYLFRDGRGDGDEPPNNWRSVFGGPAWTRVADGPDGQGQWYLHLFDTTQPDLNWRNPEIPAMFEDVLRFWLDRGVDGFRVDVAHGLFKVEDLPDADEPEPKPVGGSMVELPPGNEPMWDRPEVHEVYRQWRRLLDSYDHHPIGVAEAWTPTAEAMARYVRPDELHQAFNFHWLSARWSAEAFADVIRATLAATEPVGASPTWVLSNHDVIRHVTRYGGGAIGLARARAATLAMLALPGGAYLYEGEELGLPEVDVPRSAWTDPAALRTGQPGRDGCRVPIPWSGDKPPYGFGPGDGDTWLPQPPEWADLSVERQAGDPTSTLTFYRRALAARRTYAAGEALDALEAADGVLTFRRGGLTVVLNAGTEPVQLPEGEVLVASGQLGEGTVPVDTAVWLATGSSSEAL